MGTEWPVGKQLRANPSRSLLSKIAKKPLMAAIISIAKRWPDPTRGNCVKPNSQILFDVWERFNRHQLQNTSRASMFDAAFKIFICVYEAHQFYSQRFDWVMKHLLNSEWDIRDSNPGKNWK